jgi:NDP-mannose synthase
MSAAHRPTRAVIQAGGRGERLRPLTDSVPKPLLPVNGIPMAERLLRQLCATDLRRVTVVTGWMGALVQQHLSALDDLPADLALEFIHEGQRPLGNVGALSMLDGRDEQVLLLFGDLVTDLRFERLLLIHAARGAAITLATHEESIRLQLGEVVAEDGRVIAYREKPEKRYLICSGVAVLEPVVVNLVDVDRQPMGISDLVAATLRAGHEVTHWQHGAFWMDVNSVEQLERADLEVSRHMA